MHKWLFLQKGEIKNVAVVGNPTGKNDSILRGYEQDSMHGIASPKFAQITWLKPANK